MRTHLITAVEHENVFICGHGTIDGDSHFWVNESLKYSEYDFWGHPTLEAQRPGQMIYLVFYRFKINTLQQLSCCVGKSMTYQEYKREKPGLVYWQ